ERARRRACHMWRAWPTSISFHEGSMTSLVIARRRVRRLTRFSGQPVLLALSLLLSGCAEGPLPPSAGRDPANLAARVPAVRYDPVLRGYVSRRPADPTQWGGAGAPK